MSDQASGWKPSHNIWLIAVAVTLGAFMEFLDSTIVNVALPYIAGSLAASSDEASYSLTSYLVANGIVLTVAGWLSDTIGRKRYFMICLVMFTVFSFLCGISQSLGQLVVFRAFQGFFGGGLQPNQQAIILDSFPAAKRSTAFAISTIAAVVAPVLGPTVGGYLIEVLDWRWIFFVNLPIGAVAIFANFVLVEDPPWEKEKQKKGRSIDYIGLSLISLGLGCMQIALDRGEDDDWFGSRFIVIMSILAFVGIVGAILWLLVAKKPVVDLDVFKDRNFAVGCVMIGAVGMILYSTTVLIPQFTQQQLGYTAFLSGLVLSPGSCMVVILIPVVGPLMKAIPTRYIVMLGFLISGLGMMFTSRLTVYIDYWTLVYMRAFQMAAMAFLVVPISTSAYQTLPQKYRANGAALFSMFRNVGGAVGISLATSAVTERRQTDQAHLSKFMSPLNQGYNTLIQQSEEAMRMLGRATASLHDDAVKHTFQMYVEQAAILAYNNVFQYVALVAFILVPMCFLISTKSNQSGGGGGGH